ncbi:MAG: hypothetical protein JNK90_05510 [Planctomycetaceae bacterium]|nr:hypothetical protein [Planctomycetaceae bacterium]
MASNKTKAEKEQAFREAFLSHLNQKLAAPTTEWPTVRCWTEPALNRIFKQVRDELIKEDLKSSLSHASLLDWLCKLRLASSLPLEGESAYLLEMGANAETDVPPMELLMARKPSGIICYFSAVAFHELTTQIVEHHHIAELRTPSNNSTSERPEIDAPEKTKSPTPSVASVPRGLGELLFRFQGVPFYSTRRSSRLVPGIQMRSYGPRTQVRITTLEQTLLDTLYKPFHCGGPEVVFEAWQEAKTSHRINEKRLLQYLQAMNYPATSRRVAVMLELVGSTPCNELQHYLQNTLDTIDRQSAHAHISLLPGIEYQNLNQTWLVNTP